jgi:hypothetical protein
VANCSKIRPQIGLFDYLVGAGEQRGRNCQTKGLCGLYVNQQFVLRHLLYGQAARLGPSEDLIHVRRAISLISEA